MTLDDLHELNVEMLMFSRETVVSELHVDAHRKDLLIQAGVESFKRLKSEHANFKIRASRIKSSAQGVQSQIQVDNSKEKSSDSVVSL